MEDTNVYVFFIKWINYVIGKLQTSTSPSFQNNLLFVRLGIYIALVNLINLTLCFVLFQVSQKYESTKGTQSIVD